MRKASPLTSNLLGQKRARDSRGNTCVSLWEFHALGWNSDTARFATVDGEDVKVTIVAGPLVWESKK